MDGYIAALNRASPPLRALGITDYYLLETYEAVRAIKAAGRLPNCELIFPNVELRLGLRTSKGKFINLHLLVCPDDESHVVETRRFLGQLSLDAVDDTFRCTREELIRLGRKSVPSKTDELEALREGANQFKVNLEQLQDAYRKSAWAKANIRIAISGAETDGTSGLRDASDRTLRTEMEKFAHVILASSPAQREFWLGKKSASLDELWERYNGPKPCLHGCDAHTFSTVGVPDDDRRSWVKGALCFDARRQACIDPEGRAFVGPERPATAVGSQVLARVEFVNASWIQTPMIGLNPGLVTVIGARGSGKTALVEAIAAGCDALPDRLSSTSFLARAQNRNIREGDRRNLLQDASIRVSWDDGEAVERPLNGSWTALPTDYPRIRYLSQQFVDDLCSADGMTDELLNEIERVIFESHSLLDQNGAVDFGDMRKEVTSRHRLARARSEQLLSNISDAISDELDKQRQLASLRGQATQRSNVINSLEADRKKLIIAGSEDRVKRLAALTAAADRVREQIRLWNACKQAVLILQDEVEDFRTTRAPAMLQETKTQHRAAGSEETTWSHFLLTHKGNVDEALKAHGAKADKEAAAWRGEPVPSIDKDLPVITDDAGLEYESLARIEAETKRLQALVSTDVATAAKYAAVSARIDQERAARNGINDKIREAEGAAARLQELRSARNKTYKHIFRSIVAEQEVLTSLYAPLTERLTSATGTLGKLSFIVNRRVDVGGWAAQGETLFDLRGGEFKGRGTLREYADIALGPAWEQGDQETVGEAMAAFLEQHQSTLLQVANVPRSDQANFRDWAKRFAKWLYGTDHISLRYSIDYDGVDIRHLSPGTRGIVLLLLYLALDTADTRPLVIDQPEENLDPKSIHDELVKLFVAAKVRRQVIMVTHNANLVVNTDADQIIVADAGPHPRGQLPPMTYKTGGLEELEVRTSVCNILEGGGDAFRERARRLRVRLER